MTVEIWIAYVLACSLLLLIPGPTILTVISYSVANGRRANVALVAGVALGDSTALLLSIAGLGALLSTFSWMFTLLKWAGGLYLIFLGIKLLRAKRTSLEFNDTNIPESRFSLFRNVWLVTALNPKGIIFFVAFLPQFINPDYPALPQLWILSVTFVALATLNALLYAVFASRARQMLSSPKAQRRFNLGGGALLSIAGAWALTAKHSP